MGIPSSLYALCRCPRSFKHVVTFNVDEYVGLPHDHPESYHTFMFREFFSHIDIPPAHVNPLDGNAPDLIGECDSYEQKIRKAGGVGLFLGSIGEERSMSQASHVFLGFRLDQFTFA